MFRPAKVGNINVPAQIEVELGRVTNTNIDRGTSWNISTSSNLKQEQHGFEKRDTSRAPALANLGF